MSTGNSIQSILENGGWCQIHPKKNQSFNDQSLGRIIHEGPDYLLLQRFSLGAECLDGYFLVPKRNLKLKKAYWVKQYLTVGGQVLEDAALPKEWTCENWTDVLHALRSSVEPVMLALDSGSSYGCVEIFDSEEIMLRRMELEQFNVQQTIRVDALQHIELRTKSVRELSKLYKSFIT